MTNKIKMFIFVAVAVFITALIACSGDSSSTSSDAGTGLDLQVPSHADSAVVIVYSYEEFSNGKEVAILNSDTSKISVDMDFAAKADSVLPKPGNLLVVWPDMLEAPYYVRVSSAYEENNRYMLTVSPASPFEAIPDGDYNLSSEIYVNPKAASNGGKLSPDAFYNKDTKTFHPFLIVEEEPLLQNESGFLQGKALSQNPLSKTMSEKHYVDLREYKLQSGSVDYNVLDIDAEFHPGTIAIPGMGKTIGDYQGGWLDAIGGMEKLQKALDKNDAKNPDGSALKAYVKVDTLKFKNRIDFHLSWTTSWFKVNGFEFYATGHQETYMSNLGVGLGAGFSGEKQLTNFNGAGFTFYIYAIPIYVKIVPNLYFKYNLQAYAVMDYRLQYKKTSDAKIGLGWNSGKGVSVIQDGNTTTTYKKSNSFRDFVNNSQMVFCGKASAGFYMRFAALLYNVVGPTAGIGVRVDLDAQVGAATSYDNEGNWQGDFSLTRDTHLNLDGVLAAEAGAKVTILGYTLFERAYDVYDIKKVHFFNLTGDEPEDIFPVFSSSSHRIPDKDGPLNFSSSSKLTPLLPTSSQSGPDQSDAP